MFFLGMLAARAAEIAASSLMFVATCQSLERAVTRIATSRLHCGRNALRQFREEIRSLDVLLRLVVLDRCPVRMAREVARRHSLDRITRSHTTTHHKRRARSRIRMHSTQTQSLRNSKHGIRLQKAGKLTKEEEFHFIAFLFVPIIQRRGGVKHVDLFLYMTVRELWAIQSTMCHSPHVPVIRGQESANSILERRIPLFSFPS